MNISPRRRRRILREHQLRQGGYTLEQIAETVQVSIATVHADLRLLEEHWSVLAKDIHDDLLLHQIARIDRRVERLGRMDPIADACRALGPDAELNLDQVIQIEDRHQRRLAQAERELRMLLKQLHNPYVHASTRSGDTPVHELADPVPDRKNLKEPETVQTPIPRKTLEIAPQGAAEKISPETLNPALPATPDATTPALLAAALSAKAAILNTRGRFPPPPAPERPSPSSRRSPPTADALTSPLVPPGGFEPPRTV